jgi:hypothetical protein
LTAREATVGSDAREGRPRTTGAGGLDISPFWANSQQELLLSHPPSSINDS